MKPSQGLFVVCVGFVFAMLSMAPIGLALFAPEAPPAVADEWGMGAVMLYSGFVVFLFGLLVMAIGVIMTVVGVFTKEPFTMKRQAP